jgi:hypothetical protein
VGGVNIKLLNRERTITGGLSLKLRDTSCFPFSLALLSIQPGPLLFLGSYSSAYCLPVNSLYGWTWTLGFALIDPDRRLDSKYILSPPIPLSITLIPMLFANH